MVSATLAFASMRTDPELEITGNGNLDSVQTTNCNPALSKSYDINHIESFNATMDNILLPPLENFMGGITPIMTIFAPISPNNTAESAGFTLSTSEVHLNCLRTTTNTNSSSVGQTSTGRKNLDDISFKKSIGWAALLLMLTSASF